MEASEGANTKSEADIDLAAIAGLDQKGGKKKKRKKSAADKSLEKLEKQSDELKNNHEDFQKFLSKVDQWLSKLATKHRVLKFFQQIDDQDEGTVSYEEFKAGMLDLNAPCSATELHVMATILDLDNEKSVHYPLLQNGMKVARAHEETYESNIRPDLPLTEKSNKRCPKCAMLECDGETYWSKYPRYILVELRLAPFAKEDHPNHVTTVVQSHVTIAYLTKIIIDHTDLLATRVYLYKEPDSRKCLPLGMRLEDDYIGGTFHNPTKVTLYYDYKSEFYDCPLLMSDYYIGQRENNRTNTSRAEKQDIVK